MLLTVTQPNIRVGHLMPPEDAHEYSMDYAVVADGITRESVPVRDWRSLTFEQAAKGYPNPSGARLAADAFCRAVGHVLMVSSGKFSARQMFEAFTDGNRAVEHLNWKHVPHPDFLANDYLGCVAAAVKISDDNLYWGVIGDCGVIVFSKDGERRFETRDQVLPVTRYLQRKKIDLRLPENRKMLHQTFRNNPKHRENGRSLSYGAMTGETEAEHYVETGKLRLRPDDLVAIFSDGFWHTVRHPAFFSCINQRTRSEAEQKFVPFALKLARQDQSKYGREGTLTMLRYYNHKI